MIRKGNVKVNRKKKKQNYRLQEGDTVRVWESTQPTVKKTFPSLSDKLKTQMQRCVIYEDKDIICCNKPAGMVMHTGSNHQCGLSELLVSYTGNPNCTFVHRLDKMTSGLVMAAKNLRTARILSRLIRNRDFKKKYAVLVHGTMKIRQFTLETFLKTEEKIVRVHPDETNGAKKSLSTFLIIQSGAERTLLEATLHTGRKHQLRVQLADIGHPIVGDMKYGNVDKKKEMMTRMFLFSQSITVPSLDFHVSLDIPRDFYSHIDSEPNDQKKEPPLKGTTLLS